MHDGQIAQHRLQDQMMVYFTDKQTSQRALKCMASNALSSRIFKNEPQHMIAFVPPTQYLTTTTPQAVHCRSNKKKGNA